MRGRRLRDGYESDTYISCRAFENSLRQLDECVLYSTSSRHSTSHAPKTSPLRRPRRLDRAYEPEKLNSTQTPLIPKPENSGSPTSLSEKSRLGPTSFPKLRNIEYLMKQLEQNSLSLSPASSSEMSVPEADKYEANSQTESNQSSSHGVHHSLSNNYCSNSK